MSWLMLLSSDEGTTVFRDNGDEVLAGGSGADGWQRIAATPEEFTPDLEIVEPTAG